MQTATADYFVAQRRLPTAGSASSLQSLSKLKVEIWATGHTSAAALPKHHPTRGQDMDDLATARQGVKKMKVNWNRYNTCGSLIKLPHMHGPADQLDN